MGTLLEPCFKVPPKTMKGKIEIRRPVGKIGGGATQYLMTPLLQGLGQDKHGLNIPTGTKRSQENFAHGSIGIAGSCSEKTE